MKKYKVTRIEDKVYCIEINKRPKPEHAHFNSGIGYHSHFSAWQESESKLDSNEYEVITSWLDEDGDFVYKNVRKVGFEFFGELTEGKVKIIER